ncbi:MAG: hypothetical protein LBH00_02190 [Planctomycetaceae bacterium]|nr:hypothetical protein [Planctomycetaceae bacterium]
MFTSYIDAIRNNTNQDWCPQTAETWLPVGTLFHTNQYQQNTNINEALLNGDVVPGAADNMNRSGLNGRTLYHSMRNGNVQSGIDTNTVVQNFLTIRFQQKVTC